MRLARTGLRVATLAVASTLLATGCGLTHLQDLNFRVDDRLHFTSPEPRSTVKQPLTVTWRMDDFRPAALGSEPPSRDAGVFAVFVDETPVKPGHPLRDIGKDDPICEHDPKCPDTRYLNQHNVYLTTQTHLTIPLFANLVGKDKLQLHTITVVLVDTSGRRIGESAWELDVRLHKLGSL